MQRIQVKIIKFNIGVVFLSLVLFNFTYAQAAYSAGTLVSMTNSTRAREGLGALSVNSELTSAAYAKAQDMLANQYFAHTSPQGKTPWDFIKNSGYNYAYAGENLAIGYTDASELFSAWMASATHRQNILNPNFREIGMAVLSGDYEGAETIVVVQEFGTPAGIASEVASENSQNPTPVSNSQNQVSPTPEASKTFQFINDKSSFTPKSIFSGEEVNFSVTISGDVQTLEVQVFDQKINLLERTAAVTSSGEEKTFSLRQKIEKQGDSTVKIYAKDKNGHENSLDLGQLEVKPATIANESTEQQAGLLAGFKEIVKRNWLVLIIFGGLILTLLAFLIFRKIKFAQLAKFGLSDWKL